MEIPGSRPRRDGTNVRDVGGSLTLLLPDGGRVPGEVVQRDEDSLLVDIPRTSWPLQLAPREELVLECSTPSGRIGLAGLASTEHRDGREMLALSSLRRVELPEARRYVRIKSARPVLVYSREGGDRLQTYSVDVSGSGVLLDGPHALGVGQEISFQLQLTPGVLPVSGVGRVTRTDADGRRAIEFTSISDIDRRRITRFIAERDRSEREYDPPGG